MKVTRISALLSAAVLLLALFTAGQDKALAVELSAKGAMQSRLSYGDRSFVKGNKNDRFKAATRLLLTLQANVSEALSGTVMFKVGHLEYGKESVGAALGADGTVVRVTHAYMDWGIPDTNLKVRMGIQPFILPSYTPMLSPILTLTLAGGAGVVVSNDFSENISATAFWFRPSNDNYAGDENGSHAGYMDNFDLFGLTLPMKFRDFKVTPWAMYGFAGRHNDFNHGSNTLGDYTLLMRNGLFPLLAGAAPGDLLDGSDRPWGDVFFAGLAADFSRDGWHFALDGAWGYADFGTINLNGRSFDLKRQGWYAALLAEYVFDWGKPGIMAWYASGDDGNPWNGSERMPAIYPEVFYSSYGGNMTNYGGCAQIMGNGIAGMWAVMAQLRDLSLVDKLKHTLRLIYYRGTNNPEMVRKGWISNPQEVLQNSIYLTNKDYAFEVNIDNTYQLYENLSLNFEVGYIGLGTSRDVWDHVGYEARRDNFKCTFSAVYTF